MKTSILPSTLMAFVILLNGFHHSNEALADACLESSFAAARILDSEVRPSSVAVGDFNRDGNPDLVVATKGLYDSISGTYTNGGVSVLLGKGDGTFHPTANYGTGEFPRFVAVGDFNGDDKSDLVVANNSNVSILLGKGDGTFQPAGNYVEGVIPASVAVGDFNGDGKSDLAVAFEAADTYRNGGVSVSLVPYGKNPAQRAQHLCGRTAQAVEAARAGTIRCSFSLSPTSTARWPRSVR